jgi:hypothetical protein
MPLTEQEAAMFGEFIAPARDSAGEESRQAGLAAGRALTSEQAIGRLRAFAAS